LWLIAAIGLLLPLSMSGCDYFVSPAERVTRAEGHIATGDHRAAFVELKNALQKAPDLQKARLLLAEVTLWLGDPAAAAVELERVPGGDDARRTELAIRIDVALGRYAQALERLESERSLEPAVHAYLRARALQGNKQFDLAVEAFDAAIAARPDFIGARIGRVECLAARGSRETAKEESRRLIEQYPDSAEALLAYATLTATRDPAGALASLERASELAPRQLDVRKQTELLSLMLELQLVRNELEAARTTAERMARLLPGSPIALLASSRVALAKGDYTSATTELRRVVKAAPEFAQARFLLGVALAATGNLEQASTELTQAVRVAPELAEARQFLAQVRMRLDDPDGALRVLVPALESNQGSTRLNVLFDAAVAQAGLDTATIALLEEQLIRNPDNEALATQLAASYLHAGEPERALKMLDGRQAQGFESRREAVRLQALLATRGREAATRHALNIVEKFPNEPSAVILTASFLAHTGDLDGARRHLAQAVREDRPVPELSLALARIHVIAGRADEARRVLGQLLETDPTQERARIALAELELAAGNKARAREHLKHAIEAAKASVPARLLAIRLALDSNDVDAAQGELEEGLAAGANAFELNAGAGSAFLRHGRYHQAIAAFQQALAVDRSAVSLWFALGRAQMALAQYTAARDAFETARELRPGWLPAEGALAFLELQLGERDAALRRVEALKAERPDDAAVFALEGQIHASLREFRAAASAYDAAAARELTALIAVNAYQARLASDLPNPTEYLEKWLEQNPGDLSVRSVLADAYTRLGNRQKAIAQYEILVDKHPKHAAWLNNLAWLYFEEQDDRALPLARRASDLAPDSAAVSDTLGWILVESGRTKEGLSVLSRAAAHAGNNPEILYHYAVALLRSGDSDQGRLQMQRLLENYPTFPSRADAERLLRDHARSTTAP